VSVLAQSVPGSGLLLLGRTRPAAICMGAGGALYLLSAAQPAPVVTMGAMAAYLLIWVAGIVVTCVLSRGERRSRTWMLAGALVLGHLGVGYSTRVFLCEAFQMPSGSMIPTLLIGDHLFVQKWRRTPDRGDVVVFRLPREPSTDYLKRVVALPGETISIVGGELSINGRAIARRDLELPCETDWAAGECHMAEETLGSHRYRILHDPARRTHFDPVTVPAGHYFVLGDNRDNSNDSRVWGTVPADHIKGVATVVWYSREQPQGPIRWGRIGTSIE